MSQPSSVLNRKRLTFGAGDELETLDRLRTRASEARDIINYYYDFAKGDLTR